MSDGHAHGVPGDCDDCDDRDDAPDSDGSDGSSPSPSSPALRSLRRPLRPRRLRRPGRNRTTTATSPPAGVGGGRLAHRLWFVLNHFHLCRHVQAARVAVAQGRKHREFLLHRSSAQCLVYRELLEAQVPVDEIDVPYGAGILLLRGSSGESRRALHSDVF